MCVYIYIKASQHVRRTTSEEKYLWSYTFTFFFSMICYRLTILSCSALYIYCRGKDIRDRKHLPWKITLYSIFTCDDSLGTGTITQQALFLSDQWNQPLEGAQAFNQSSMSNVHKKWRIILVMPLLHTQDVKEERLLQSCLSQKTIWDLLWVI